MKQSESSRPDRGIDHEIEERSVGLTRAAGVQNGTATAHRTTAMDLREEIVPLESCSSVPGRAMTSNYWKC
jgi:hypothetical protein